MARWYNKATGDTFDEFSPQFEAQRASGAIAYDPNSAYQPGTQNAASTYFNNAEAPTGPRITPSADTAPKIPKDTNQYGFRLRLAKPDGNGGFTDWTFTRENGKVTELLKNGYKVVKDDGSLANVNLNWHGTGGETIDGLPVPTILTGKIAPEQVQALKEAGEWQSLWDTELQQAPLADIMAGINPDNYTPPASGGETPLPPGSATPHPVPLGATPTDTTPPLGGPLPSTGGIGNFTSTTGNTVPNNWQDLLKYLTNAGLNRSLGSNGLIDLATGQLNQANSRLTNTIDPRLSTVDQFISSLTKQAGSTNTWRNDVLNQMLYQQPGGGPGAIDTAKALAAKVNAPVSYDQNLSNVTGQSVDMANQIFANANKPVQYDPNLSAVTGQSVDMANQLFAHRDEQPGFTPEGRAALRLNQTEAIPAQFNDALSGAYTELARRGALGGELPGSQEDLTRILAPIYGQRAAAYSGINANNILAEEKLKQEQLQQNRGLASTAVGQVQNAGNLILGGDAQAIQQKIANMQAQQAATGQVQKAGDLILGGDQQAIQQQIANMTAGQGGANTLQQLMATLGGIYDPNKVNNDIISAINSGTGIVNAGTSGLEAGNQTINSAIAGYGAGNQPLQTAAQTGSSLAENQPTSVKNLLLSALLGMATGGQTSANPGGNIESIIKILGGIFGGSGGVTNPTKPSGPVFGPPAPGTIDDWLNSLGVGGPWGTGSLTSGGWPNSGGSDGTSGQWNPFATT